MNLHLWLFRSLSYHFCEKLTREKSGRYSQIFPLDSLPIGPEALFRLVLPPLVITGALHQVWQVLADHYGVYDGKRLVYAAGDPADEEGGIAPGSKLYGNAKAGQNDLVLAAAGNDEAFTITALFDNLGKGASGAAVQNMNIMLGLPETTGLL